MSQFFLITYFTCVGNFQLKLMTASKKKAISSASPINPNKCLHFYHNICLLRPQRYRPITMITNLSVYIHVIGPLLAPVASMSSRTHRHNEESSGPRSYTMTLMYSFIRLIQEKKLNLKKKSCPLYAGNPFDSCAMQTAYIQGIVSFLSNTYMLLTIQ